MAKYGHTPWKWDPENLRALLDETGIPIEKLALSLGVSKPGLYSALQGRSRPVMGTLWQLADYFAVPLDYICGRCDDETARSVLEDYPHRFSELRRAAYEQYVSGKKRYDLRSKGIESPWPYCLLDAIVAGFNRSDEDHWDTILSEEQERGLQLALDSLSPRERDYILHYYRDGETLEEVAKLYGITRERIRQVIARGLRKLRHPTRMKLIRFGADYVERESEYAQRIADLEGQIATLTEKRDSILLSIVNDTANALEGKPIESQKETQESPPVPEKPQYPSPDSITLSQMDLSVRSYNCLKRAGMHNMAQVIEAARDGSIMRIRNFGRRSLEEVIGKICIFTGEDYKYIYDL